MQDGTSKTKIKRWARRKLNPKIREILAIALKNPEWKEVAKTIAYSTRKQPSLNLWQIEKQAEEGKTIVIPGKVLSKGNLSKKLKICAVSISENAKEKLKESKSEFVYLLEEIKKNPKAQGVQILK